MKYKFRVPPTKEVGSYSGVCSDSNQQTHQQDALWSYNSARAHDGLLPIKKMPRGTEYIPMKSDFNNKNYSGGSGITR